MKSLKEIIKERKFLHINEKLIIGKTARLKKINAYSTDGTEYHIPITKYYVFYDNYHRRIKIEVYSALMSNVWFNDEEDWNPDDILYMSDDLSDCAKWVITNVRTYSDDAKQLLKLIEDYGEKWQYDKYVNWMGFPEDFEEAVEDMGINDNLIYKNNIINFTNKGWLFRAAANKLDKDDFPEHYAVTADKVINDVETWEKFKNYMKYETNMSYEDIKRW